MFYNKKDLRSKFLAAIGKTKMCKGMDYVNRYKGSDTYKVSVSPLSWTEADTEKVRQAFPDALSVRYLDPIYMRGSVIVKYPKGTIVRSR